MKTIPYSSPFALWRVISVTMPRSSSSLSCSEKSAICCRNSSTEPSSAVASYSRPTPTSSSRFSSRTWDSTVRSARRESIMPLSSSVSASSSPTPASLSERSRRRSITDMKRPTALIAAAPRAGISSGRDATSQTGSPSVLA